ncbi:hypothetical protein QUG02_17885 [Bacillus hominis]|uniref:Extracellular protein n=2 Tax=Bacillus cereus group TaxID=86661 RepID=A0A2C3D803_BACCE|nr:MULTISPECIES: hypothetical protein [Bacillus cereus group]EJQ48457.1 hypothetical protein IEQ_03129 [Bacillus cereus BAG6X1-2]SCM96581.1 Uncharacterized protein BWINRASL_03599 [Bacillus mycoides]MDM5194766.1 hypothetical protein [Bacillus hominis]MDM5239753.1 hypothetical protein [Bacillus cereus]MDM5434482.1 hypothetical protein [Bacillus hominis]
MKRIITSLFVGIFLLFSVQTSAFAYSYGNPNEEKVAEAYKQMVTKLDENPANFKEAKKAYENVQEEIDQHMGKEPSKAMMKDFDKQNKEDIIADMQKILALNINRRLTNVDENFKDYDTSKRLLAKAFATYEALSPVVGEHNKELDNKLKDEFNKALESLGNPGLFGVGQKEANQEAFKKSKDVILTELQKEFKIKDFKVGHFSANSQEDKAVSDETGKTEWTDLSSLKNWAPIVVIVLILVGVIVYAVRKRK